MFLISLCAFGIGSTPFYTLGTAYLHDNSPEEVVSVYVGILYAMGALGPAIGFLCGALFISFYEDPFNGPPKGRLNRSYWMDVEGMDLLMENLSHTSSSRTWNYATYDYKTWEHAR